MMHAPLSMLTLPFVLSCWLIPTAHSFMLALAFSRRCCSQAGDLPAAMAFSMASSMAWHSGGVAAADIGDMSPSPSGVSECSGDIAISGDMGAAAGVQPV